MERKSLRLDRLLIVASALSMITFVSPATSQEPSGQGEPPTIKSGDRVRITLARRIAPGPVVGTVASIGVDTLVVERDGDLRSLARGQIATIEVSQGRKTNTARAAGYGVLAALPVIGLLVVFLPAASEAQPAAYIFIGAVVAGSALLGALIGGTTPEEDWVEGRWPKPPEGQILSHWGE